MISVIVERKEINLFLFLIHSVKKMIELLVMYIFTLFEGRAKKVKS